MLQMTKEQREQLLKYLMARPYAIKVLYVSCVSETFLYLDISVIVPFVY